MRFTIAPLASALVFTSCGAAPELELEAPSPARAPIINGEGCGEEFDSSSAVAIILDATIDFGGFGTQRLKTVVCTGTVIAPDVVLTAAHCLDATASTMGFGTVLEEHYFVTFQEDLSGLASMEQEDPPLPDDALAASEWAKHESFDLQGFSEVSGPGNFYDVGLLFLSDVVAAKPEVVLTPDEGESIISSGTDVVIVGWGQQTQTSGFEPPPEGTVGVKQCAHTFINEVGSHEMQIGGDASTSRKCHGDSGGPTYAEVETTSTRTRRIVGVTSHAYDQEDCNKGGVDTRVDAWFDWIDAAMRERCENDARAWCEVEGVVPASYYDPPKDDDDDDDDVDGPVTPPPFCACVLAAGDSETAPPSVALLVVGGLLLALRRRRQIVP